MLPDVLWKPRAIRPTPAGQRHAGRARSPALDARVIEKHFTDDNRREGLDHLFSPIPGGVAADGGLAPANSNALWALLERRWRKMNARLWCCSADAYEHLRISARARCCSPGWSKRFVRPLGMR